MESPVVCEVLPTRSTSIRVLKRGMRGGWRKGVGGGGCAHVGGGHGIDFATTTTLAEHGISKLRV